MNSNNSIKFIWENEGTIKGVTVWKVEVPDGRWVADVKKERGTRQGCRGIVRDNSSPSEWTVTIWENEEHRFRYTVAAGSTFREVKKLVEAEWLRVECELDPVSYTHLTLPTTPYV